jgi:hypothetical protein
MIEEKKSHNYRKYSYSENNIEDFKVDYASIPPSELTINLYKKEDKSTSNFNCEKFSNYIFKRCLMLIVHLSLIALFEIIFFFNVITNFENNTFINLIGSFTKPIAQKCLAFNKEDKTIITYIFNSFVNISTINENANEAFLNRTKHNNLILIYSWLYFIGLVLLSIILIIINYFRLKKVNLMKIFIDNIFMIILLGCYEYMFFKSIILNYLIINNIELTKYIIDNLSPCLTN